MKLHKSVVVLLTLIIISPAIINGQISQPKIENREEFIEKFFSNKKFRYTRILYPISFIHPGDNNEIDESGNSRDTIEYLTKKEVIADDRIFFNRLRFRQINELTGGFQYQMHSDGFVTLHTFKLYNNNYFFVSFKCWGD